MQRLGLDAGREEIERLVAVEARRRELEGDSGEGEFYNDKVSRRSAGQLWSATRLCAASCLSSAKGACT